MCQYIKLDNKSCLLYYVCTSEAELTNDMIKISQFTGENYDFALYQCEDHWSVGMAGRKGLKTFKDEFTAIDYCEGYIDALNSFDYCINLPHYMEHLKDYIKQKAINSGTTQSNIIIQALNLLSKSII